MTAADIICAQAERWVAAHPDTPPAVAWHYASADRRRALADAIVYHTHSIAGPHLSGYPTVDVGARIVLGEHPHDIAPMLSRREACEWVRQSVHATPIDWLWSCVAAAHPLLAGSSAPRTIAVVRWVDDVCRDPARRDALLRTREAHMGEQVVEGRVVDRLDELRDEDLRRSVEDTIAAATQRIVKEQWSGPDELVPPQPWHDTLPPGVTIITTFSRLFAEGAEMRHCAAAYARDVADRRCIIASVIGDDGRRSTVEVREGKVIQHRGARNEAPPPSCVRRLAEVLRWS